MKSNFNLVLIYLTETELIDLYLFIIIYFVKLMICVGVLNVVEFFLFLTYDIKLYRSFC